MHLNRRSARLAAALFFICALACAGAGRTGPAKPIPAGEVVVVLPERLFNALLEALFTLPQPPTFPLSGRAPAPGDSGGGCTSAITLLREQAGTRTSVVLRAGTLSAPVAFSGTYNAPVVGCLKFQGWADTTLNLAFEPATQRLVARLLVREVHLSKVPALMNNGITGLVQDALDARLNPIELLRADQLSVRLPLTKTGNSNGALRLRARAVRHEVAPGELRLRVVYEFVREP